MGAKRVLVVSTLVLAYNWSDELFKWTGETGTVCYKSGPASEGWVFTNFETQQRWLSEYQQPWDVIIVDESILVKTGNWHKQSTHVTQRWDGIAELSPFTNYLWLLSGSPTTRYNDDLFGQLTLLYPKGFTSYWRFARNYCHVEETKWGSHVTGSRDNIDIPREFRDLMFVRSQKDVFPDLPEGIYETRTFPMYPEQAKLYWSMFDDFIAELESGEMVTADNKLAQLIKLQQIVSNPLNLGPEFPDISVKRDAVLDMLETGQLPTPCIIWSFWKVSSARLVDVLQERKYKTGVVNGSVKNAEKRIEAVRQLQAGKLDVLVMSAPAGKHGLTITEARSAVYVDKTWDGDAYIQSLARILRRGLNHSPLIMTLKCRKTTDELVEDNLIEKARSIARVSNADLVALLRSLSREG